MAVKIAHPVTFRARGLSDAIDGTNAFPGAMAVLQNLIPDPSTRGVFVPRPSASFLTAFPGQYLITPNGQYLITPNGQRLLAGSSANLGQIEALLVVGNIAYGMIANISGALTGKSQPFAYNLVTGVSETITGILGTGANLPASQPTTGDWTPPIMAQIGSRIMVADSGFAGAPTGYFVGWLDISNFTSNALTGTLTPGSNTVSAMATSPIAAGYAPGMTITAIGIPAGATIVSMTATSVTFSGLPATLPGTPNLTVTGGTSTSPQWGAGNTNTTGLNAVPVSVAQFFGRAYYAVLNGEQFSDSGNPTQITSATQAITHQNGLPVTALAGLPLYSSTVGGMIQSLIAFQGDAQMWQITGDASLTAGLSVNALNVNTGTLAPLTIVTTPYGLTFIAPDGLRIIDFTARVSDPIGDYGDGVVIPFQSAINPTRMCAAYNQGVYRVSVQNGAVSGQPQQEYWYDTNLKIWTGPHTAPNIVIQPWNAAGANSFVAAPRAAQIGSLYRTDPLPSATSSYTEFGAAMAVVWTQTLQPDDGDVAMNAVAEADLAIEIPVGQTVNLTAMDDVGNTLDALTLSGPSGAATVWGSFVWGADVWGTASSSFYQQILPISQPWVFKQMALSITGTAAAGLAIGNFYTRQKKLNYKTRAAA